MRIEDTRMARLCAALTLTVLGLSCGGSAPSGPSAQPPPATVAPPTLSGVTPAIGATSGGLGVTITGTGFTAGATVSIGGAAATAVAAASATSITATTPPHAAGSADVVVTNPDGQSGRLAGAFNYETPVSAPPAVTAIGPSSGPAAGGTSVTVSGGGFAPGATVSFGTTPAGAVSVASATTITAMAPAGSAGSVDVVVTNADGQSGRLSRAYTYVASAPPPPPPPAPAGPSLSAIAPTSTTTAGGAALTLTGSGFSAGATVSLGGTAASSVVVASGTSITAVAPPHAAGAVDVVVTNADGQSARLNGGFTYTAPAPPPPPPAAVVVVTITSAGTSPSTVTIAPGTRVRFVNNDASPHEIASDPHLVHTQCPEINAIGVLLPGQSRETDVFTAIRTCGYHDHRDSEDPRWTGTIIVR